MKKLIFSACALLLSASAAAAGPAIALRYTEPSRWKGANLTQEACLARAEATILATNFTNIERTQQSRYGTMREYTAAIRCIMDKQIVIIIVSGPSPEVADRGAGALFQNFESEIMDSFSAR